MKNVYIISLLLLAGCASHYSASDGSINSDKLASDTKECNQEAYDAYQKNGNQDIIAGAAVGGAIGGLVASSMDDGKMTISDIQPYVDKCMKGRGYNVVVK